MTAENKPERLPELLLQQTQELTAGTIFTSERNRRVSPIPREQFYTHGNGIDIKSGRFSNGEATQYEKECFKKITSVNHRKNTLILGPHFIDEVFTEAFSGKVRPDAIQFNVSNEAVWALSGLYEFKSGNVNGPVRKLNGFARLLNDMRKNEEHFPSVLKEAMPWAADALPNRIVVPPEKNISVFFVSPDLTRNVVYDAEVPPFQVAHIHFIEETK